MFTITDVEEILLRPRTAKIIFWLLAGLLSYELISGVFSVLHLHAESKQQPVVFSRAKETINPLVMQKNLSAQIFGEYLPRAIGDLDMKKSGLNLSVVGVLFSPGRINSQAMIMFPGGHSEIFSVGDQVPGGAKIKQITPDGVVLEHDGELESLSLPKNELVFEALPQPLSGVNE